MANGKAIKYVIGVENEPYWKFRPMVLEDTNIMQIQYTAYVRSEKKENRLLCISEPVNLGKHLNVNYVLLNVVQRGKKASCDIMVDVR